jgi:hypothetical protein
MTEMSFTEIGKKLMDAGRLSHRPIVVFGSEEKRQDAVPMTKVDRCIARAIFSVASKSDSQPIYISEDSKEGCCMGGLTWFGYAPPSPMIRFFVSTGTPKFRNGEAEHLKRTPELVDAFYTATGKIHPMGRFINIAGYDQVKGGEDVRSYLLLGSAEQIRNLGGLIQFDSTELFNSILMPGGPSCASFVSYASDMVEKAPKDTAFVGPVDPTGNAWFPPELMSLSVPLPLARRMAANIDDSFLKKRTGVAFPDKRMAVGTDGT